MYLDEFFEYKNQLMKDILTSETICELLYDDDYQKGGQSLAYTRVFPYEYVPETSEYGGTYICFDVDVETVPNSTFLFPIIGIWVFSHKSKLRLPEGGVRTDKICCEISKLINGSREYGMGELNLAQVKRFAPMTDYNGKYLRFIATDWNRTSPTGKPVPSRRKS